MKIGFITAIMAFWVGSVCGHVRRFSQTDFNKWLDNDNYVVALFCSSMHDQECVMEKDKMQQLSEQMVHYNDIIFGYIDKETDALLITKYDIQNFPTIKFFPYSNPIQTFYLNIPVANFKDKIIQIRNDHLSKSKGSKTIGKISKRNKKKFIVEIEEFDFESLVKNEEKHVMLIMYERESTKDFDELELMAKTFEEENEVAFYKLNLQKSATFRDTFSFPKDPTLFWYPKNNKKGFVYGGKIALKVLVEYVNDYAGLSRSYTGELKMNAGRIVEIDQIVEENILSILQKTNINSVIEQIKTKVKALPHSKKYIDYYVGVLKEIRKGSDPGQVLNKEQDFLNKKINQVSQTRKESDEWKKYYNIISVFVDFAAKRHQEDLLKAATPKTSKLKQAIRYNAKLKEDMKWHDEL